MKHIILAALLCAAFTGPARAQIPPACPDLAESLADMLALAMKHADTALDGYQIAQPAVDMQTLRGALAVQDAVMAQVKNIEALCLAGPPKG